MELSTLDFAVVDVEATGGRVNGGDRIMEISVVHVHGGVVRTALDVLVDPQRAIPPFVSRLTGIRRDMIMEAPTFGDIAEQVHDALDGRIFVAHNVRFDWRFVTMEVRRALGRTLRAPRLCTVKLARKLLTHLPRRNLDALAWHYDVPITARHRAGGDAMATARVLTLMLAELRRRDIDRWDQLHGFLSTPSAPRTRSYLPQPVAVESVA
jgi:DNA polymerase III subunit epsilon